MDSTFQRTIITEGTMLDHTFLTWKWLLLFSALVFCVASIPLLFQIESRLYHGSYHIDPEVYMNATELISSKGFPVENYYVTTADGYILNLVRIPHGRHNSDKPQAERPVILLQHGLLGSCTNWLVNLVDQSLAYILADAGADVWMGNSRGNIYSMNHTHLTPKDDAFWNFSFDEMAKYDLPATINFILQNTGKDQLYYVGHSQGTTIAFAQWSEDQELASKIKHFIAFAPVARVAHAQTPLRALAPFANSIADFLDLFGHGEFGIESAAFRYMKGDLCQKWGAVICENLLFLGCGFDFKSLNQSRVPVYEAHNPAGASVVDILHWAQEINSKEFQKFDFGSPQANMVHYNQSTAPLYNPKNMKVPTAIFRGGRDWLAADVDVEWLLPQLNVTKDVYIKHYEHLDFIWAYDANTVIYNEVLKTIFS